MGLSVKSQGKPRQKVCNFFSRKRGRPHGSVRVFSELCIITLCQRTGPVGSWILFCCFLLLLTEKPFRCCFPSLFCCLLLPALLVCIPTRHGWRMEGLVYRLRFDRLRFDCFRKNTLFHQRCLPCLSACFIVCWPDLVLSWFGALIAFANYVPPVKHVFAGLTQGTTAWGCRVHVRQFRHDVCSL